MRFHIQFRVLFVLLNNNILTVKSLGDRQQVFGESFKCLWGNYGEIFFLNKHVFPLQNLHHFFIFFFKKLLFFNWRIIALQRCVHFCHTSTWIRHRYTYIPSLLKLSPIFFPALQIDTEPLFEFPESYSKFSLAIYFIYDKVYVSMPLSQFIPQWHFLPSTFSTP